MPANDIVHFSDASLIAIHALAVLAEGAADAPLVPAKELSAAIGASDNHLSKVMQRLSKSGLVLSTKGPSGGFRLARPAGEISFLDAIEAIDGEVRPTFCPFRKGRCDRRLCIFGDEIERHSRELVDFLRARTFAAAALPPRMLDPGEDDWRTVRESAAKLKRA
ncbi:MAG: Rrf2 family transcriptional regulator [Spirochaetales bacterium]|nr:Rrf2 family transcriptional regulator [Spirochaetales bacterium]